MDSGNSGSMQSSSGGGDDQEFDSRGESISSFLNPDNFASISAPPPQFLSHQTPNFFDPNLSHTLDQSTAQFSSDHDLIWSSRGIRPDQSYPSLGNLSSLQPRTTPSNSIPFPGQSSSEPRAPPPPPQQPKNPKKRTRASRRAPTTVLTTDTSNFRQMVQEFTGIPAAPFSGSPYSRRLDLFSAASALRSGGHLDTLYPLRPSAQKPPPLSPFSSSPSLLHPSMIPPPASAIGGAGAGASTSNNFQLSTEHLLNIQQSAMNFGFLGRNNNNDDSVNRWKSGEGNDGGQENLVGFDGNINSGDSQNLSGYNLNLAEKGMENAAAASTAAEGTTAAAVASWICPSD